MVFKLDRSDVMEHLWGNLEKSPDGKHIRYSEFDVEQLWAMGFVDTQRVGLDEWKAVFDPMRQADGSYRISHAQFLDLDKYRYTGEIRIPFDAMLINEGKYTDEGLDELIDSSIAPSCVMPRHELYKWFDKFKKDFRESDELILIKEPAKQRIAELLGNYPSPLRNLEMILNYMLETQGDEVHEAVTRSEIDAVTTQAALQVSSFSSTPSSRVEEKAQGLRALQKTKKKKEAPAPDDGKPKTELKKIRRSRKGVRG